MPPAAADDNPRGNLRELTDTGAHSRSGKFSQRRRAIFQRQAPRHRRVEIIAVERFGRGLVKHEPELGQS